MLFLLSFCLFGTLAFAQSGKGSLSGRVADSAGAVLQGAQVELLPRAADVATNSQGEFKIANLNPGTYTIKISYVGFEPFTQEVTIIAGKDTQLKAVIKIQSNNDEVTVLSERQSAEAEAINRTRAADNLLQVLPGEVITSLPNANIADALGRLPSVTLARDEGEGVYVQVRGTEPRLTNITIDGTTIPAPEPTVRQVRLDALAASLVESVEINKTLSANMDGDGIGGSVNIKTKTATETPTATLSGVGGYTPILGGRGVQQYTGTVGKRFGETKKLGILLGGNWDYTGRGIDDIEPTIDLANTVSMNTPMYSSMTVREYRYYRTRWGLTGSLDYKFREGSGIYLRGVYSDLMDFGDKWYYAPYTTKSPKFYTSSKSPDYMISSLVTGGKHVFNRSWFSWDAAASRSRETASAGNPKADFSYLGSTLKCPFSPADQTSIYRPVFGVAAGCNSVTSPMYNPSNWGLLDITTSRGQSAQLNLSGSASYARNYNLGGHPAVFEFGGKIRNGHKYQNATETVYDGWKATLYPMTSYLSDFHTSNFYGGTYAFGPVSDFNKLKTLAASGALSIDPYKTAQNTAPNTFNLIERISAGYLMNTVDLGRFHIQTGIRFEGTQIHTLGNIVQLTSTTAGAFAVTPTGHDYSYIDPLPSINVRYALSKNSGIRASYAFGVARPDPYQLIPYATSDTSAATSTTLGTVSLGNPNLKPEHANNYDLLFEHYLKPTGMLQLGFFYKSLTDPMFTTSTIPTTGQWANYQVSEWFNGSNAHLYGFETSYQQRFTFMPGALRGLGLSANYSYTASQQDSLQPYLQRTDSPALQRQAPNTWNVSPTYDNKHLSVRLGLTYNGTHIYNYLYQATTKQDPNHLGLKGPGGDQYVYSHLQVDAQASYRLYRGFHAMVSGLNLSNAPYGYYTGSKQFVLQREYYKPSYAAGVRWTSGQEH